MSALQRSVILCGAVSLLISVIGTLLTIGVTLPYSAAAQSLNRVTTLAVTADPVLGNILTDSAGFALYYFDDPTTPTGIDPTKCLNGPLVGNGATGKVLTCLMAWPPLLSSDVPVTPVGLTGELGVIDRADFNNVKQVTYNGAPLYYFVGDREPGDTRGNGSTAFGGGWPIVKVD